MKKGFDLFDHIYCINMKSCVARKNHMIEEFKKIKVSENKYSFIEAIDGNTSEEVKQLITKKGKVNNRKVDNRPRKLSNRQIGNWLSHIKVWETIVKKNHLLTLICEDDLCFIKSANEIVSYIFSKKWMLNEGVVLKEPVLFRLGYGRASTKGSLVKAYTTIGFTKDKKVSNPCYAVSLSFAKSLIRFSKTIRYTSDTYVHKIVAKKHKHFTITPPIAHDLSLSIGEFKSEINPKKSHVVFLQNMIKTAPEEQKKHIVEKLESEEKRLYEHRQKRKHRKRRRK